MSEREGNDRRRERRVATQIDVDVKAEGTFLFAQITDISSMGIFVHADKVPEAGTELTLRFDAPPQARGDDDEPTTFELRGEVVWTTDRSGNRAPGMGVKFIDLPEGDRGRLLELVNAMAYFDDE
jgi:uncharacterized protein (TIGR02266 family)